MTGMAIGISALPLVWAIQRFPIGKTLSVFVVIWGLMVMLTAVCKNYAHLVVVRVFLGECRGSCRILRVHSEQRTFRRLLLGVFEAPILPGFVSSAIGHSGPPVHRRYPGRRSATRPW